jgi:transposase
MPSAPETLPEDPAQLKAYALSQQREIQRLNLIIAKLQRSQFGRRAETLDPDQLNLLGDRALVEAPSEEQPPEPPASKRRKAARKPLPAHLPREDHRHDVGEQCDSCGGQLHYIGEDVSEMLEYIPARFKVIRHIRPKWSCPDCQQIIQAPAPERPIPNGLAGPDLLAQVLVSKYCDHQPLHRQSRIYARDGVELARSTLADWVGQASGLLKPLVDAIHRHVVGGDTLHADDTPIPVLDPGRGRTKTGRLWTYVRDEQPWQGQAPPAVWFAYTPNRQGQHPQHHLRHFSGVVHADGFAGFNALYANGCREAACMAHVRRKFYDIHEAKASPLAIEALAFIRQLYQVEEPIRGKPPDARRRRRQQMAVPILAAFKDWLAHTLMQVSQKSELAKAIRYALSRWAALTRYCEDGRIEIDNNAAERALRGVALGRKNYLFAGSDQGGERAAALYSLIETAKLNDLDPMAYLRHVLSVIGTHPINRIDQLLPWQIALPAVSDEACEAA